MFVPPVQFASLPPKQALKYVGICCTASIVNAPEPCAVEPKRFSCPAILSSGVVVAVGDGDGVAVLVAVAVGVDVGGGGELSLSPQPIPSDARSTSSPPAAVPLRTRRATVLVASTAHRSKFSCFTLAPPHFRRALSGTHPYTRRAAGPSVCPFTVRYPYQRCCSAGMRHIVAPSVAARSDIYAGRVTAAQSFRHTKTRHTDSERPNHNRMALPGRRLSTVPLHLRRRCRRRLAC